MNMPAYVAIAGDYARRIRSGELSPGARLPSYEDIAKDENVSKIVVRMVVDLLQSQGLVRKVERKGVYVTDRPNLQRVSPERQMESAESSFAHESNDDIVVSRDIDTVPATTEVAESLGIAPGDMVTHTITRASEGGHPVSISDTYQPIGYTDISTATALEETIRDAIATPSHAEWLNRSSGELIKSIHQTFTDESGRIVMVSNISYPRDRYDSFVFRMSLRQP